MRDKIKSEHKKVQQSENKNSEIPSEQQLLLNTGKCSTKETEQLEATETVPL